MKDEIERSIQHLEMVSDLAQQLADRGITVYRHTYDYLAFGSWEIVVGTRKHRVRLTWDGKESRLDAASSVFADSQSTADWKHLESSTIEPGGAKTVFQAGRDIILRYCAV